MERILQVLCFVNRYLKTRHGRRYTEIYFCIDRIDGAFTVLISDDGERIKLGLSELPEGIEEGSILTRSPAGYVRDKAEEENRRVKARKLLDKMFE